jgi:hypothetical protein
MQNKQPIPEFIIQAPFLQELVDEIRKQREEIESIKMKLSPQKAFYTLAEACELKGVSYGTLSVKKYHHLRPNCGKPDAVVCSRERWTWETIQVWMRQSDDELIELGKQAEKSKK